MGRDYSTKYYRKHKEVDEKWATPLARCIVRALGVKSMIDLGCGVGSYLLGAHLEGVVRLCGVEYNHALVEPFLDQRITWCVQRGDITLPFSSPQPFDCVLSVEVGEHIRPEGTGVFVENLRQLSSRLIVLTAAPPGQRGTQHINLRPRSEWISLVEFGGEFVYRGDLVIDVLSAIGADDALVKHNPSSYIARNLMIFARR